MYDFLNLDVKDLFSKILSFFYIFLNTVLAVQHCVNGEFKGFVNDYRIMSSVLIGASKVIPDSDRT
ncbi:hypothetical protein IW15_01340 [Chryseobacterium soli]|uniref:Uncharacterized protein n=1 Tax=Chryseobacterium soli TaxID=445961 RepID=A0A086ABQ3_9FLAO|nr:hypothetical protein IW15_01340 [Chryseobacterium soli]